MGRAVVLGGTGVVGAAVVRRLLRGGWEVGVVGRDSGRLAGDVAALGGRFMGADRHDPVQLAGVCGGGVDLLVDCLCFTAEHARQLVPFARESTSTVMISSKAVYVDEDGRHVNSDVAPRFSRPIRETDATVAPGDGEFRTRAGYGPNKVAAEQVLLDSGAPVTVLRASKVHGVDARRPREWYFVKRVLDRRPVVLLAGRGLGADHPSAAVNLAALVETVAGRPGRRVLNSADPDVPTGREIAAGVAERLGHRWEEILLDESADPALGRHPWDSRPPIVLDTTAATDLGYRPVGDHAATVAETVDRLASAAVAGADGWELPSGYQALPTGSFDYPAEDAYLAAAEQHSGR
ncbi:NAD-dependent epimerase/dehydratase family protein [Nocardia blacklockiae]|uniref:NAD-dependent epimerase/dehydratase family protein n=1 Tax=Nocardia blacklockiae TaxID=480036 RepID=UPI0018938055|nr:NAD-dependent epimerase/dehydratase family protein [Nocardia blacklockiae]MBF6169955.1 NAD-dependent epimerase/dehydratase family protein [Nocardia blacklockiae]